MPKWPLRLALVQVFSLNSFLCRRTGWPALPAILESAESATKKDTLEIGVLMLVGVMVTSYKEKITMKKTFYNKLEFAGARRTFLSF